MFLSKRKEILVCLNMLNPDFTNLDMKIWIKFCFKHVDLDYELFESMIKMVCIDKKEMYSKKSTRGYYMDQERFVAT